MQLRYVRRRRRHVKLLLEARVLRVKSRKERGDCSLLGEKEREREGGISLSRDCLHWSRPPLQSHKSIHCTTTHRNSPCTRAATLQRILGPPPRRLVQPLRRVESNLFRLGRHSAETADAVPSSCGSPRLREVLEARRAEGSSAGREKAPPSAPVPSETYHFLQLL